MVFVVMYKNGNICWLESRVQAVCKWMDSNIVLPQIILKLSLKRKSGSKFCFKICTWTIPMRVWEWSISFLLLQVWVMYIPFMIVISYHSMPSSANFKPGCQSRSFFPFIMKRTKDLWLFIHPMYALRDDGVRWCLIEFTKKPKNIFQSPLYQSTAVFVMTLHILQLWVQTVTANFARHYDKHWLWLIRVILVIRATLFLAGILQYFQSYCNYFTFNMCIFWQL